MKTFHIKKLTLAGILVAVSVVGSSFSFPVLGSKCAPVQHIVNVLCAVLLGPSYAVMSAFLSSFIRNALSLGTLLAFPGSMFGAWLSSFFYQKRQNLSLAFLGEVFGTAVLGGLAAYPIAILFMGKSAASIAFYAYVLPFFISTFVGALLAFIVLSRLKNTGILLQIQNSLRK